MINIVLNDDAVALTQGNTIDALLTQASIERSERIAIAVNDTVISRSDWPEHKLNENDQVLMIAPIQGG